MTLCIGVSKLIISAKEALGLPFRAAETFE
jgi:hypothetical protein